MKKKSKNPPRRIMVWTTGLLFAVLGAAFVMLQILQANNISTFVVETSKISTLEAHPHQPSLDSISDDSHHVFTRSDTFIAPYDLWIKGFNTKVINANDSIVHHLFLGRTDQKDKLCPNYNWQAIYVTSEVNATPQILPADYAMFFPKGTPLKIYAMLHNPTPPLGPGKNYHDVSVQVLLYTQKNSIFKKHVPVEYHRLHLSDKPCGNAERAEIFEVPPDVKSFVKKDSVVNGRSTSSYIFPTAGVIVGIGGHFHPFEGGENVEVNLNGTLLDTFTAVKIPKGTWKTWSIPVLPYYVRVKKGDNLSISSTYSNPNPFPVRGAMGMSVFYFAKDQ